MRNLKLIYLCLICMVLVLHSILIFMVLTFIVELMKGRGKKYLH